MIRFKTIIDHTLKMCICILFNITLKNDYF